MKYKAKSSQYVWAMKIYKNLKKKPYHNFSIINSSFKNCSAISSFSLSIHTQYLLLSALFKTSDAPSPSNDSVERGAIVVCFLAAFPVLDSCDVPQNEIPAFFSPSNNRNPFSILLTPLQSVGN